MASNQLENCSDSYRDGYTGKTEQDAAGYKTKPGKPVAVGRVSADAVSLFWEPPKETFGDHSYQIRFKENKPSVKWTFHPELSKTCSVTLNNLKTNTQYVVQVRMVDDESEGPYSNVSDPVETVESAAHALLGFMEDSWRTDVEMPLKKLCLTENMNGRNNQGKTRKMVLGEAPKTNPREKTIMLVGATGTGKSTLVEGMINYILGVTWKDPYRLTLVDLVEDEIQTGGNQTVSQTKWITCYTIYPSAGSRLDYTLNVIDTPGFGDTQGIERDREIIEQIRTLFSRDDEKGVLFIDAICFLVKAPDARLTPTQKYIFQSILSLFGQDIKENICMLITFADGKKPPVVSALKEMQLPNEEYYPFNNSGLFASNDGGSVANFSAMFWEMGCESFKAFFHKLNTVETRSLRQTREVLKERQTIEVTLDNLIPKLNAGLSKVEELRVEIRVLEDNKAAIEANKDFKYKVNETRQHQRDLERGHHVTNCLNCHRTCHLDCQIPDDGEKYRCWAMDGNRYCTQCPDKCFWTSHKNTPYIFEYITVSVENTYAEKLEKYTKATGEKMTREKIIERMKEEVLDMEDAILAMMTTINECNNRLRRIALKPDPLSMVDHIDLLIESEKQEKKPGYLDRIRSLQDCRKKATIGEDVDHFRQSVHVCAAPAQQRNNKKKTGFFGLW